MQYLLFLILIMLVIVSFLLSLKDVLAPSVIVNLMFLFCCFFTILNTTKWGIYEFKLETVIFIVLSLSAFTLGCAIGNSGAYVRPVSNINVDKKRIFALTKEQPIKISFLGWLLLMAVCVFALYIYAQETFRISLEAGNDKGLSYMIYYSRIAQLRMKLNVNRLAQHLFLFCKELSYIMIFIFFYNVFLDKFRFKYLLYFFPTVVYSLLLVLNSGRFLFIHLFVFIFIVGMFCYKISKRKFSAGTWKVIKKGSVLLIVFFTLFQIYGVVIRKDTSSLLDTISIYAGSGIYALDRFMELPLESNTFFGSETLISVYLILNKLGFKTPSLYSPRDFIEFANGYQTNVFTAFRRYYVDYRVFGTLLFLLMLGIVYGYLYYRIRKNKKMGFLIILSGILYAPLVEFAIEERFLLKICSLSMIYELIYLSIIYLIIIKRKKRIRRYK